MILIAKEMKRAARRKVGTKVLYLEEPLSRIVKKSCPKDNRCLLTQVFLSFNS
jgi:hypothetical protein